jgi:hypothetical protein
MQIIARVRMAQLAAATFLAAGLPPLHTPAAISRDAPSIAPTGALSFQTFLSLDGLHLSVIGATSLLLERVCVLTIHAYENSCPTVTDFVIPQNEPFGIFIRGSG